MSHSLVTDSEKQRTAESFGYEWKRFNSPMEMWEENFRGYFQFFSNEFFHDKRILEAGSGMGRHTYYLSRLASEVVAIDLSEAIHVTAENLKDKQNVRLVKADIDHLPFKSEAFDFVCSIGVLHHLPDPVHGLFRLVQSLRPGGTLHVYLYWALEDAPGWKRILLTFVTFLRRLTVKLPHRILDLVAWVVAVFAYLLFSLPYRFFSRFSATARLVKDFPFQRYGKDGFRVCYNDQFDRLSAPLERRYTRNEVIELFSELGLTDIQITQHYGWIACGRKPRMTNH